MNWKSLALAAMFALIALPACTGREHSTVTGGYGDAVISGEVVMQGVADGSPAGVIVSVRGTGMTKVLGADGKFAFAEVPDGSELDFRRASDGVDASLRMENGESHVVVALAQSSASRSTSSKRRGVGRGGDTIFEFEGVIRSVSADSLVVFTSKGVEQTIGLAAETVIRKGDQVATTADLVVGGRIHVKAKKVADAYSALLVIVQPKGEDDGPQAREYEGTVRSVTPAQLVIADGRGTELTFVLNGTTVVRKGDAAGTLADLAVGQRVHVKASVGADETKTALSAVIQRNEEHPAVREFEGTVSRVSATELVVADSHRVDVTFVLAATTVVRRGDATATVADLAVGQRVHVKASVAADGTKTAVLVTIQRAG